MNCEHKNISVVFAEGAKLSSRGHEKDLVVGCTDCKFEIFRTSVYNKRVFNLIP